MLDDTVTLVQDSIGPGGITLHPVGSIVSRLALESRRKFYLTFLEIRRNIIELFFYL